MKSLRTVIKDVNDTRDEYGEIESIVVEFEYIDVKLMIDGDGHIYLSEEFQDFSKLVTAQELLNCMLREVFEDEEFLELVDEFPDLF